MLRVSCGSCLVVAFRRELKIASVTAATAISAARLLKLYEVVVSEEEAVV